jgi:hypothetical protein
MPADPPSRIIVQAMAQRMASQKSMAERAFAQVPDELLHRPLDENTNSIAVIVKHLSGNLRSRFTDFLTSDGEKPDRDRDGEFIDDIPDRAAMLVLWEAGWKSVLDALATLSDEDLMRTVTIRGEPHSVIDALCRALAHVSYHVGQIVQLSRYLAKDRWTVLTIPRGASKAFNQSMEQKFPAKP